MVRSKKYIVHLWGLIFRRNAYQRAKEELETSFDVHINMVANILK